MSAGFEHDDFIAFELPTDEEGLKERINELEAREKDGQLTPNELVELSEARRDLAILFEEERISTADAAGYTD